MTKEILKKIVIKILELESRLVIKKYKPKIVAVTGNLGKTSAKDAIYTVLSGHFFVRKSDKSFNSDIGIPLTILGCPTGWNNPAIWLKNILNGLGLIFLKNHYPKWLVLEVGADRPGDIKKISKWLRPDVVVVTGFGEIPVHVEFFPSVADLVKEKSYLIKALKKGGTAILGSDDKYSIGMKENTDEKIVTYGFGEEASVKASHQSVLYDENKLPTGMTFKLNYGPNSLPVNIMGTAGRAQINSVLAALAVGVSEGLNIVSLAESVNKHETPPGRLRIIKGLKGSVILDDTYNSSPKAISEALDALAEIKTRGKKLAILGDMMELGKYSRAEHEKAGEKATKIVDILAVVGLRAKFIAEGAMAAGISKEKIFYFENSSEAGTYLNGLLGKGSIVLVKGSQSMRMERAVEKLMQNPENRADLLVRQEKEWLER